MFFKVHVCVILLSLMATEAQTRRNQRKRKREIRRHQQTALNYYDYGMSTMLLESNKPIRQPSNAHCGFVRVDDVADERKIQFGKIYNGVYYVYETSLGKKWERTAENRKGQLITVFIRRGMFRVGNRRAAHGWLMGYELKNKYSIVRYYARNSRTCPTGSTKWRRLAKIKRFKNVNSVLNLGINPGSRTNMLISPYNN